MQYVWPALPNQDTLQCAVVAPERIVYDISVAEDQNGPAVMQALNSLEKPLKDPILEEKLQRRAQNASSTMLLSKEKVLHGVLSCRRDLAENPLIPPRRV